MTTVKELEENIIDLEVALDLLYEAFNKIRPFLRIYPGLLLRKGWVIDHIANEVRQAQLQPTPVPVAGEKLTGFQVNLNPDLLDLSSRAGIWFYHLDDFELKRTDQQLWDDSIMRRKSDGWAAIDMHGLGAARGLTKGTRLFHVHNEEVHTTVVRIDGLHSMPEPMCPRGMRHGVLIEPWQRLRGNPKDWHLTRRFKRVCRNINEAKYWSAYGGKAPSFDAEPANALRLIASR